MQDYYKYILSKKDERSLCFSIAQEREIIKKLIEWHHTLSINMEHHWFQKSMQKSREELFKEYVKVVETLEKLEPEQAANERKLYMHASAMAFRATLPNPFEGVNLSTVELVQLELF